MNYLIKILILFLININMLFAVEITNERILFKIENSAYTSIDLEIRKKYLKLLDKEISYSNEFLLKDYISVLIFSKFYNVSNHNFKKLNINKKYKEIFSKYENQESSEELNKIFESIGSKNILLNLKYDLIRKLVIEDILNSKRNEIFDDIKEIDLLYDFRVSYITIKEKDLDLINNQYNKIKNKQDFIKFKDYLSINKINYINKENDILEIEKLDSNIKEGLLKNRKIFKFKFDDYINIVFIEKKLENYEGIKVKIISIESKNKINNHLLNCSDINKIDENIIENKYTGTYLYSQLNQKVKENLFSVNDFLVISNNNKINYIFLCELIFDENILKKININKKINIFANEIENDFVKKYSNKFNLVIMNE